jgi:predicted Fe-Mo cluster-binding NifX family protein
MKIAVPYENGQIFGHFGKTEAFKIYDVSGDSVKSEIVSTDGRGHHDLAPFLKEHDVEAVVCGGMGTGMVNALTACGIAIYGGNEGDCDEAVRQFLKGSLQPKVEACHCHEQ